MRSGQLFGPVVTEGIHSDRSSPFRDQPLAKGSLKCCDLGYFDLHLLRQRQEQGVFTLGRVHSTVKLFDRQRRPIQIEEIAPKEVNQAKEVAVLMGTRQSLPVRLLLVRVPKEVEAHRKADIRREAKERGTKESEAALKLAPWTALFTDAPAERLSLEEAVVLQRQRWQMEIFYKVCKQINEVDEWATHNPWRILCEVFAKLIAALLQHWMTVLSAWKNPHRSLCKCAQVMQDTGWTIMEALAGRRSLRSALETIGDRMQAGCEKNKRRGRPNAAQLLEDGLPWILELLS